MSYLSSLVTSWSARRSLAADAANPAQAPIIYPAPTLDNAATQCSAQDVQACDALLDDFLDGVPDELSLIDLACYNESLSPSKVT